MKIMRNFGDFSSYGIRCSEWDGNTYLRRTVHFNHKGKELLERYLKIVIQSKEHDIPRFDEINGEPVVGFIMLPEEMLRPFQTYILLHEEGYYAVHYDGVMCVTGLTCEEYFRDYYKKENLRGKCFVNCQLWRLLNKEIDEAMRQV